jgi:hypothetical protein
MSSNIAQTHSYTDDNNPHFWPILLQEVNHKIYDNKPVQLINL